jgi:hypothetical protein
MAATKSQGRNFGLFLVAATLLCGGIGWIGSGIGKLLLAAGAVLMIAAAVGFIRIKPIEGKTPVERSPETMKWVGAGTALLGWLVTVGSLHVVDSNGGRIFVALLGIGVSLVGILYVLPATFNRTAFWKAPGGTMARPGLTPLAGKTTVESGFATTPRAMESVR